MLVIPTGIFLVQASRLSRWIVDDAAITFAYARNLVQGNGFVAQPGGPVVEGYSNPTWLAALIVGKAAHLFDSQTTIFGVPDYVWFPKMLAVLCFIGTVWAVYITARSIWQPAASAVAAAALAGIMLAAIPSYVIWAVSGLENGLYGLLIAVLIALLTRAVAFDQILTIRAELVAAVVVLLLVCTRPDGAVYLPVFIGCALLLATGHSLRERCISSVRYAAMAGCGFAVVLTVRWIIFRQLVPNTAIAKGQDFSGIWTMGRIGDITSYLGWAACLFALVMVVTAVVLKVSGSVDRRQWLTVIGPTAIVLGAACTAFFVLNKDWMDQLRFATPIWVAGCSLVAMSTVRVLSTVTSRALLAVCVAAVVAAAVLTGQHFASSSSKFVAGPTLSACWVDARYSQSFAAYAQELGLPQPNTLALADVGGVLLAGRQQAVDIAGLVDPKIASLRSDGRLGAMGRYVLNKVRPEFINVHGPWGRGITSNPKFSQDYVPIYRDLDYVRRDLVTDEQLAALRAKAPVVVPPRSRELLLGSCGDKLGAGTTN